MHLLRLASLLFSLAVPGCGGISPVTNGSQTELPDPGTITVVWGQHKGAVGEAMTTLQQMGFTVVERSRLQQVFDEQKIRLTHSTDDDAQILKVGKILGAASIAFVEVETSSSQLSSGFVNQYGGGMRSETVTNASVSVRGVNVESGTVMWTGSAHYPEAITNPEAGIIYLTQSAIVRGLCPAPAWNNDSGQCDSANAFGSGKFGFKLEKKNTPEGRQLVVATVPPNSPADRAGLKAGDIILACNEKSGFQTVMEYRMACRTDPGQTVTFRVKRGDTITNISATAVSRTEIQK